MSEVTAPGDGDSELAAPAQGDPDPVEAGESARSGGARPRPSNAVMLIAGILVIVVAQLVTTFLVLTSTNQLRDQYTSANGLQRCLIRAQLNANTATDPSGTAYKAAVNNCLK